MSYLFPYFFKKRIIAVALIFMTGMIFISFKSFSQTTYTWNQTATASWITATNWTPSRITPAANDKLVFNNAATTTVTGVPTEMIGQLLVSNNTIVNLQAGAANNVLTVSDGAGSDISVVAGSSLNNTGTNAMTITLLTGATASITGNMTFSVAPHKLDAADAGAIVFNSPAIFTQDIGCTGNVFTNTGTANAIIFGTGTTFIQNVGASPFGLTVPNSKVIFQTGNLFIAQQNSFDTDRTYANFEYNAPVGFGIISGSTLSTDNLTITHGTLTLNNTGGVNIKGNLSVVAGSVLNFYTITSGVVAFNGTLSQNVTNAGTLTFGNNASVTFNNPAGITLNSNITFKKLVTFTSGIVTIPNPTVLTLGASATVAGVSNSSFADGRIAKIGNTLFTFPVGKTTCGPSGNVKGYAALTIENFTGGAITDVFTAEYKRGNALSLGTITAPGLNHISACDYWTLTRDNGASTVDITLSWNDPINNCSSIQYINNRPSLTIAHNDNSGGSTWNTIATAGATSGTNVTGTVAWSGAQSAGFGAFVIGSIDFLNPLPITLNYFTGTKQNGNHLLNWQVNCNSSGAVTFNLESSADNRSFVSLYRVTADAIRCSLPFNYTNAQPEKSMNYYRLKMTDANGKISYSSLVALLNADKGFDIVSITPNPVINKIPKLNITSTLPYVASVIITDIMGSIVKKQTVLLIGGLNTIDIDAGNLSKGTYNIVIASKEYKSKTLRFVKQ